MQMCMIAEDCYAEHVTEKKKILRLIIFFLNIFIFKNFDHSTYLVGHFSVKINLSLLSGGQTMET